MLPALERKFKKTFFIFISELMHLLNRAGNGKWEFALNPIMRRKVFSKCTQLFRKGVLKMYPII